MAAEHASLVDLLSLIPPWVLLGIALGGVASGVVAAAFYLGDRVFPSNHSRADGTWTAGDERRRREIRAYLIAIGEAFKEDHGVDGVTVPFYLPARGVAITFDAHDYFQLEGAGVYAVLCEHEMPGRGLGRRLPFDVDEPEWGPTDEPGGRSNSRGSAAVDAAFTTLDVSRDADADTIKRAYRERVKETHPDQGGDEAAFREVQEAYATARAHVEDQRRPQPADRSRQAASERVRTRRG